MLKKLNSSIDGINRTDEKEMKDRIDNYGKNEYKEAAIKTIFQRIYDSFNDSILRMLFVGSIVSILIGIWKDLEKINKE